MGDIEGFWTKTAVKSPQMSVSPNFQCYWNYRLTCQNLQPVIRLHLAFKTPFEAFQYLIFQKTPFWKYIASFWVGNGVASANQKLRSKPITAEIDCARTITVHSVHAPRKGFPRNDVIFLHIWKLKHTDHVVRSWLPRMAITTYSSAIAEIMFSNSAKCTKYMKWHTLPCWKLIYRY